MGAYATGSLGGGISVPYPRTPAAGDLLILWVSVGSTSGKAGANPPTPSGWTMARQGWSGTAAQANIFYRIATGTESGSVAVGAMSGCVEMGRMAEFRGNRTTSAWWGGGGTGIGAATSVTATVTSAGADPSAGNLVVASGSVWLGASSSRTVTNFSSNNAPLTTSQLISTTGWYHYAWGYGSTTANAVADNTTLSVNSAWTNAAMIVGSFNVDPVTPAITLSLPSATTGATFTITPSISTGESGIGSVTYGYWSSGTGWLACATSTNASPVSCTLPGDGSYSIDATVTARNGLSAGYYGLSGARYGITYDHTAPTPTSVAINSGAPYTVSTAVTLTGIAATDTLSGVANMQFSNDAANWSAWQPYAASASWTLSPGDGVKAVYARFQDAYGNGPSNAVSGTIVLDGTPPTAGLAYPEDQRPIAGDVTVTGTASDAIAFASYTLDFGTGSNPSAWTPIATGTTAVPTTAALGIWHTNGLAAGIYTLRLTATDQGGNSPAVATRLVYVDNTRLGQDAFITRVPFDLGGGWSLGVGVEHGDATLGRTLFTIPSYGPEESLSLAYNSQDPTAGAFGTGWSSNFTQYLSFESGFVVWHREDGGRVPFGQVAGTWTPLAGDFERLAAGSGADAGRYIVTQRDQTRLVFEGSGAGRLLRIDNRFGKSLAVTWGSGTATMTDSSGRQTTITFTGSLIVSVIDSALRTWAFGYTGTDLTTVAEPDPDAGGPLASPVTTLTYSGHQLTTVARTRRTAAGGTDTPLWAVGYTGGKATSVVDPIAHKDHADVADTFAYSAGNTVVSLLRTYSPGLRNNTTYSYDGSGRVTSQLDPGGYATTYHYDFDQPGGNSLLTSVDRPIDASTTATTSYSYDAVGNILTETRPLTSPTDTVTTVMTYNASNDLVTRSEADGDPALQTVTLNTYSGGHLVTVVRNCTSAGTTPPSPASSCTAAGTHDASTNLTTSYTYTANGQVDTETDPLGRVTKHAYDQFGNETSVTGNYVAGQGQTPDQNVTTSYTYPQVAGSPGLLGLATSQTDPTGAVTTYGYDILGRRTSEVDPADATISALTKATTYDELGNVLTETDSWPAIGLTAAGSRLTTAVYDLANRPTSVTDSAGSTTRQYDAAGEETQTVSAGVATGRVFDGLGNLVTETTGTGGTAATTTRTFDAQGHELTTTVNSATTTRTFDYAGRPLTETVDGSTTTHQYDKLGHEITTADPTGGTTTRSRRPPARRPTPSTTRPATRSP